MKEAFFWCYPWDLEDEGVEVALGRMAGELGLDALAVATTYHSVEQFRPRVTNGPRWVFLDAAAHFQPSAHCYANTGMRPVAAGWMKSRNPLEKIARAAEKEQLKLRAWTVCCHSGTLVRRHPMTGCVDVFGGAMGSWLCPSNPDVREYIAALVSDLSNNYLLDAIELEAIDFGAGPHRHRHHKTGLALGPFERALWSWCFCASCRQRACDAGVDAEAVVASVTAYLERLFRLQPSAYPSMEAALEDDALLAGYFDMRCQAVSSLLRTIQRRTEIRLIVHAGSDVHFSGADVTSLSEHCGGWVVPAKGHGTQEWRDRVDRVVQAAGTQETVDIGLNCYPPHIPDGPALVAAVHAASRSGHPGVGFYNYGVVPDPCLDWVRQAVRYARREASR